MTGLVFPLLAALVAVLPGAFTLWRNRSVAKLADDPALPERLLANRTRGGAVSVFCFAILILIAGIHLAWALPLFFVSRMAAAYPLRKVLYRETWSLGAYLSFFLRLVFATFGFWILLGITPSVVVLAGSHEWIVGGALSVVLFAWGAAYSTVFRAVLRARPVDDPVLVASFARMLKEAGLPTVTLEQVDLRGGVFANAVALPSARRPMVVVSSTLVERLDHEEAAAILAHELAHIEHFNRRRLRRMSLVSYALVASAALLSPVIRLTVPEASTALLVLWPVALVAVVVLRAQHGQKHETASDLRALALAGDSQALIRALTKLHAFAYLPRRWDTEFERHATHPSLARRIQAINAAAGTPPASLGEAATFAGTDGSSSVTFHDDRLLWNEGPSASHAIDYGQVSMLRVDARRSGAPRLVAVDCANRRWEMELQSSDVARAQATLDIVDTRLAVTAGPPAVPLVLARTLAMMALMAAITIAQFPIVLLGAAAILLPAPSVTAAAGAAAVGAAALIWRDQFVWMKGMEPWTALALMICGLGLIAVSVVNRRERERERSPGFVSALAGLLAVGSLLAWGALALSGIDAVDLHYAALEWPSAAVLPLALAGAFAFARRPALRYASVPLATAGLVAAALGSTSVLDRFANDPFLPRAGSVTVTTATRVQAEFPVPFVVSALRLSPAGNFVALGSENEDEETTFHAGAAGGPLTSFAADEAVFVDEGRLLLLERQRGASVLRVVDLHRDSRDVWSLRVPMWAARLLFDAASSEWRLLGLNEDGDIVTAAGTVGDAAVREERWKTPVEDLEALSISGRDVLALETVRRTRFPGSGPFWWWMAMAQRFHSESRFWTVSEHGSSAFITSRFDLSCRGASAGGEATTCASFDGTRTGFFAVDPETRRSTALASVPGRFYLWTDAGRGWVVGAWDHELVLLRAKTRQAVRVDEAGGRRVNQLAIADQVLGAASWNGHGSTIRLYSTP